MTFIIPVYPNVAFAASLSVAAIIPKKIGIP